MAEGKIRGIPIECVKRKQPNEFTGITLEKKKRGKRRGRGRIEEWTDAVRSNCNDQLEMFQLFFFFSPSVFFLLDYMYFLISFLFFLISMLYSILFKCIQIYSIFFFSQLNWVNILT